MTPGAVLIVDDEQIARENLAYALKKEGYDTCCVDGGKAALAELKKREFDLVMTDLRMPEVDGMEVLRHTKSSYPETEVIVITGHASVSSAVEAMHQGAYHYLSKPYQLDEVRNLVMQAMEKRSMRQELSELKRQVKNQQAGPLIIGNSPKVEALKTMIAQIAPTDCSVLILGETGTGKELVARTIHHLSNRADKRFMAVNCGAFNEELLTNELFGHEKDAFTGARGVKKGIFEVADGGTILLDEIGDMPISMQVKLLRVLQERTLMRVGGTREIPIDVRVLAATNKDLKREAELGTFRQDLYYRINVITLTVPHLAARKDDIPLLCRHFMKYFNVAQGKAVTGISDEVMEILMSYEFPGNIRELENVIERAVALAEGTTIEVRHLPGDLQDVDLSLRVHRPHPFMTLEENEKEYIAWVLQQVSYNKTKAAAILSIDRVSLWRKLRRYNLDS
ncbi:MAG: sigma-54-dependent Fis family transcriptional regulator [Deltaproteobacteria bacterium]|nr:sigma-54-dependent Fis family transcriptional regulator [Deltaproteobacteria bacterium]